MRYTLISSLLLTLLFSLFPKISSADESYCFPIENAEQYVCSFIATEPQFIKPAQVRDEFVLTERYGRLADNANVYRDTSRASEIVRNVGDGFLFSSIQGVFKNDTGELWYMINVGEFVHQDDIALKDQSVFRGVEVTRQPTRPFGWVVARNFTPSIAPGAEPDERLAEMLRYEFIEVFNAVEADDGWIWYDIGDGRWVNQQYISIVDVDARPEGVGENDLWVEVDVFEQTLAAYEGDQLVFATLISSGLNRWPTYQGLYNVDADNRFVARKMSGAEGKVDYYFVEDVPHTMYFDLNTGMALHGAYWHDRFGYKHSHGCVNLPPQDSEWIYYWSQDRGDEDFFVYVWESNPAEYFDRHDSVDTFAGA